MEWLSDLRYDRPAAFWAFAAGTMLCVLAMTFFLLPANDFFRTVGVTAGQKRAGALYHAVYWQARAQVHASAGDTAPKIVYGNVLGIDPDATVLASVAQGETFEDRRYRLADVVVTDVPAAARLIANLRLSQAKLDVYGDDQAVVWINREPLNVRLIEEGAAKPDPNPPTNIVDVAFARYYWSIVKGDSSE